MAPRRASLLIGLALLTACGGAVESPMPETVRTAQVHWPESSRTSAIVVLVPGGGWYSADPGGLVPLAEELAAAGFVAATTTYRAAVDGERFPVPVEDVLCAAASAVEQARESGRTAPLVLVGHSAGAHLAALAALRPDLAAKECPHPAVEPDAVVGLAGAYDVRGIERLAVNLFGVPEQDDRELWHEGDVLAWVDERRSLPVLLVHGDADDVVPVAMSRELAAALSAADHPVQLEVLPGVDHNRVYQVDVVAPVLVAWLGRALAPA
jgi:acetyl esterase/lipase